MNTFQDIVTQHTDPIFIQMGCIKLAEELGCSHAQAVAAWFWADLEFHGSGIGTVVQYFEDIVDIILAK